MDEPKGLLCADGAARATTTTIRAAVMATAAHGSVESFGRKCG
jgi:hypothetical protein